MDDIRVIYAQPHFKYRIITDSCVKDALNARILIKDNIFDEWILNPLLNDPSNNIFNEFDRVKYLPPLPLYKKLTQSNSLPNIFLSTNFKDRKYYCNTKKIQWINKLNIDKITGSFGRLQFDFNPQKRSKSIPNMCRNDIKNIPNMFTIRNNGYDNDSELLNYDGSVCNGVLPKSVPCDRIHIISSGNEFRQNKNKHNAFIFEMKSELSQISALPKRGNPTKCTINEEQSIVKDIIDNTRKSSKNRKKFIDVNCGKELNDVSIEICDIEKTTLELQTLFNNVPSNAEKKRKKTIAQKKTTITDLRKDDLLLPPSILDTTTSYSIKNTKRCNQMMDSDKSSSILNDSYQQEISMLDGEHDSEPNKTRKCQSQHIRNSSRNKSITTKVDEFVSNCSLKRSQRRASLRSTSNILELSSCNKTVKRKVKLCKTFERDKETLNNCHTNTTTSSRSSNDDHLKYRKIRKNIYTDAKPSQWNQDVERCSCKPSAFHRNDEVPIINGKRKSMKSTTNLVFDCRENCLNRLTYTECDSKSCPCGVLCRNQKIKKLNWAKGLKLVEIPQKGRAVFTAKLIEEGSLITEYVGEVITETTFQERMINLYREDSHHYCLHLDGDMLIDAYRSGSVARFVNHSCQPNCEMQKWMVNGAYRMCLFANKDIDPQTELTYDYNFCSFNTETVQKCLCNSPNCRGFIGGRPRAAQSESQKDRKKLFIAFGSTLTMKKKVFVQRHSIFLIRGREIGRCRRLGIVRTKRTHDNKTLSIVAETKRVESKKSQFLTQMSALNSVRYVKTRLLQNARDNESITRTAQLAQVLRDLYTTLLELKDPIDPNCQLVAPFLRSLKRKEYPEFYDMVGLNGDLNLNQIYSRLLEGKYATMLSFDRDVLLMLNSVQLYAGKRSNIGKRVDRIKAAYLTLKVNAIALYEVLIDELIDANDKDVLLSNDLNLENIIRLNIDDSELGAQVIKCVCEILVHDGNPMVQCDRCSVWQHSYCMTVSRTLRSVADLPIEPYLCHICLKIPKESLVREIPEKNDASFRTLLHNDTYLLKINDFIYISSEEEGSDREIIRICRMWKDSKGSKRIEGRLFLKPFNRYLRSVSMSSGAIDMRSQKWHQQEVVCTDVKKNLLLNDCIGRCCVLDNRTFRLGRPKSDHEDRGDTYVCDWFLSNEGEWSAVDSSSLIVSTKRYCFERFLDGVNGESEVLKRYTAADLLKVHRGETLAKDNRSIKEKREYSLDEKRLLGLHLFEEMVSKLTEYANERTRKLFNSRSLTSPSGCTAGSVSDISVPKYHHHPRKQSAPRKRPLVTEDCNYYATVLIDSKEINSSKDTSKNKIYSNSSNKEMMKIEKEKSVDVDQMDSTAKRNSRIKKTLKESFGKTMRKRSQLDDEDKIDRGTKKRKISPKKNVDRINEIITNVLVCPSSLPEDNVARQRSFQQSTPSSSIGSFCSIKDNEVVSKEMSMEAVIVADERLISRSNNGEEPHLPFVVLKKEIVQ